MPNYRIGIDCWFLTATRNSEKDSGEELRLVSLSIILHSKVNCKLNYFHSITLLQVYPNTWGSVNKNKVIIDINDLNALKEEAKDSLLNSRLVVSHDLNYRLENMRQRSLLKI